MTITRMMIDLTDQEIADATIFFAHLAFYDYAANTPDDTTARRANALGSKLLRWFRARLHHETPACDLDDLRGVLRRARKFAAEPGKCSVDRALMRHIDLIISALQTPGDEYANTAN